MAYDLKVRLTLVDNFSRRLESAKKAMDQMDRQTNRNTHSFESMRRSMDRVASSGILRQFRNLAVVIGGVTAATKAFNLTVGEAARQQLQMSSIEALFGPGNQDKAAEYFDFLRSQARSTMFGMDQLFSGGRTILPMTKNLDVLKQATNIAERLVAQDPFQTIEDAAFALREMFSGDAMSMIRRFELPRDIANMIKTLPIEQQVVALDKLLNKMGVTDELIQKQAATGLGQYRMAVNKTKQALVLLGDEGLERLKPALTEVNRLLDSEAFEVFTKKAADVFGSMFDKALSPFVNTREAISNLHKLEDEMAAFEKNLRTSYNMPQVEIDALKEDKYQDAIDGIFTGLTADFTKFSLTILESLVSTLTSEKARKVYGEIGSIIGEGVWEGIKDGLTPSARKLVLAKERFFHPEKFMDAPSVVLPNGVGATPRPDLIEQSKPFNLLDFIFVDPFKQISGGLKDTFGLSTSTAVAGVKPGVQSSVTNNNTSAPVTNNINVNFPNMVITKEADADKVVDKIVAEIKSKTPLVPTFGSRNFVSK